MRVASAGLQANVVGLFWHTDTKKLQTVDIVHGILSLQVAYRSSQLLTIPEVNSCSLLNPTLNTALCILGGGNTKHMYMTSTARSWNSKGAHCMELGFRDEGDLNPTPRTLTAHVS